MIIFGLLYLAETLSLVNRMINAHHRPKLSAQRKIYCSITTSCLQRPCFPRCQSALLLMICCLMCLMEIVLLMIRGINAQHHPKLNAQMHFNHSCWTHITVINVAYTMCSRSKRAPINCDIVSLDTEFGWSNVCMLSLSSRALNFDLCILGEI